MFRLKKTTIDIGIVCSNFEESLRFYHDLLGLEIVLRISIPEATASGACLAPTGFRQVRLRAGDTLIKLMEITSPPGERTHEFQAGVRWLTLIIDDVPSTVEMLRKKGVEFLSQPVSAPDAKHVVCAKGPDGMLIEFVQLPD